MGLLDYNNIFVKEKMLRRARKMKNHYIICGAGKTGIHVIKEMQDTSQKFIVIESEPERVQAVKELVPDCIVLEGDATDDAIFELANLRFASGLIATLSNDKDNLYLCLSAKMSNPNVKIVARAYDMNIYEKFKKAGADYIVSPNFIGGMRMASEILRPHVVSFLDTMLRAHDRSIRMEESFICEKSSFVGKTFSEIGFFESTGVNVLAISQDRLEFNYNFSREYLIQGGEIIIYICNVSQRKKVENFLGNSDSKEYSI